MASLMTVGTNSYITEAEASAYFSTKLNVTAWDNADSATREKALIIACQTIEQKRFVGVQTNLVQPLQWPRQSVYDINGNEYDVESFPASLQDAQCEEALMILKMHADKGAQSMETRIAQGSNNVKIGDIAIIYSEPVTYGGLLSQRAWMLLQPLLLGSPYGRMNTMSGNMLRADAFFKDHRR